MKKEKGIKLMLRGKVADFVRAVATRRGIDESRLVMEIIGPTYRALRPIRAKRKG
jgi:hypothetical protein